MRYLTIGHICQDLLPNGWLYGGAITYSSRMARVLGCQVEVFTSAAPDFDVAPALHEIKVNLLPAAHTTTFENVYTAQGRRQTLHAVAASLTPDQFAGPFEADIVHLAPIAQEVDLAWLDCFPGALLGVTPQGWMRQWDAAGHISPIGWAEAAAVLPRADVVIVSIEDVAHNEALIQQWATQAKLLVVTRGAQGCTLHQHGETLVVPTRPAEVVDATGAGDIFAASFMVRWRQTGDVVAAARFANCLAGHSLTRRGLDGIPTREEAQACLAD